MILCPFLEPLTVVHIRGNPSIVKLMNRLVIRDQITPPSFFFECPQLRKELPILSDLRTLRVHLSFNQRMMQKQIPRSDRINRSKVHRAAGNNVEPVQRDPFIRNDPKIFIFPSRIRMRFLNQVRPSILDPLGLNPRHRSRVDLRGPHHFPCHHPVRTRFKDRRPRNNRVGTSACPFVFVAFAFVADVGQQSGQQRAMDRIRISMLDIRIQLHFQTHPPKLPVHLTPFINPTHGEIRRFARTPEFASRQRLVLIVVPVPDIQIRQEVRPVHSELLVRLISNLLLIVRANPRVLRRQHRRDNQHIIQTVLFFPSKNHPSNTRIHRQAGHLLAHRCQLVVIINRTKFVERFIAITPLPSIRSIQERELVGFTQS